MTTTTVPVAWLTAQVARMLCAVGVSETDAATVATALVDADRSGISSHGTLLAPLYVDRILHGSVAADATPTVVRDLGAIVVLDAKHSLGHTSADAAMALAVEKAKQFGIGAVTVRHAFHFGAADRYVESAANAGLIGIAASNTRPLMPAPGGARAVIGNNPLAIGIPRGDPGAVADPIIVDLAMSEVALGKIRVAASAGERIPEGWATDSLGETTTDPVEAIAGMLLPMGGPKGYGLAIVVEMLTGVLGGGAFGPDVKGLYADPAIPYDCSFFFLAIDPSFFDADSPADSADSPDSPAKSFAGRADALARWIESSPTAPGIDRVFLPGQRRTIKRAANAETLTIASTLLDSLRASAERAGISFEGMPDA
jgi:LDH2 family malate/lactate/ureidoglycolate dehydrogenase